MGKRIATLRQLRELVREDYERHGRRRLSPGFHALAVYRFGVWVHDKDRGWLRGFLVFVYRALAYYADTRSGIELPYETIVGRRLMFPHGGRVVVNREVVIGHDCMIRQNVTIGSIGGPRLGSPRIGDRVEIGAGAVVIGDIRIGDDVLIGANIVLWEDVPDCSSVRCNRPEIRPRKSG